ncbi:MAG: 2Fe-2S iron-sulfur cluster-binding protein, partial [Wenzhouxiangellaceae bacterium]
MTLLRYAGRHVQTRADESVLDALLRAGIDARFSCRSGSCHVCMLRCTEGEVPQAQGVTSELRELGYFLACQCIANQPMSLEPPRPEDFETVALVAESAPIAP